jgi:hypothetical protein
MVGTALREKREGGSGASHRPEPLRFSVGAFRKERSLAHLGTASEAQAIAHGVSRQTLRMWLKRGWIRGVQVGGRTLYDLASVAAMVQPIGKLTDEERAAIAELVADSPDPSDEQIAAVRQVIHGIAQAEAGSG